MSAHGEAAEQVVDMATKATVKGVEVVANLTGKGLISLATFLIATLKEQKRTKGKTRIEAFRGKPTKVFVMRREDFSQFAAEAKKYGVLYAAIMSKKDKDGMVDVVVNANDAARVNRISERFAMSAEEVEKLRETILKAKEEKSQNTAYKERTDPTAEKDAHTVDDATLDEMMGNATPPQQTQHKQPVEISEDGPNPTKAGTAKSSPSAPLSEHNENTEMANTRERPSVRQQIKEIKEERQNHSSAPARSKTKQTQHMLDNRYALLFIRGERPLQDEKYDILKHPDLKLTTDGGALPYAHGKAPYAFDPTEIFLEGDPDDYEVLSEEEVNQLLEQQKQEETKNETL